MISLVLLCLPLIFCGAFFFPLAPSSHLLLPFQRASSYVSTSGLPIYVELSPSDKGTLNSSYLYPVKKMSFFDAFKLFGDAPVDVTCPECAKSSPQNRSKVKKNVTLICPHCGHYFRKRED
ncbi:MAG: YnfU family zinc-binding protein [Pseudomonadota bacterium]|uniref:YnfU family zinc-binding protein n=1 Tax=Serratia fonticola TaxID=47917 RepID=UPI000ADDDEDC|nr:YnfU family zinc-binding protein [Serratia fonticola]MBC3249191.1 hypothetical protein [Serratia fonticola]